MGESEKFSIDKIKEAAGYNKPKDFVVNAGEGILVSGGANNWVVSADPSYGIKNLKLVGGKTVYTLQICVNGSPMNLDVYVARQPY